MSPMTDREWEERAWYAGTSTFRTTKTWARRIFDTEELPETFKDISELKTSPYVIYLPADANATKPRVETVISLDEQGITVWEIGAQGREQTVFAYKDMMWLEEGRILLNGWFVFRNKTHFHMAFFNATNRPLFHPLFQSIRKRQLDLQEQFQTETVRTPASILALGDKDFALMNFTKQVVGEQEPEYMYFQPPKDGANALIAVGYTNELVFCQHTPALYRQADVYGRIYHFIPLPNEGHYPVRNISGWKVLKMPLMPEDAAGRIPINDTNPEGSKLIEYMKSRIVVSTL